MLQSLEFKAFDLLMQLRPPEPQDSRILVVEITNENSKKYNYRPIPNKTLSELVDRLEKYEPEVIGINILRTERIRNDDNVIYICDHKSGDHPDKQGNKAPNGFAEEEEKIYVGFSDIIQDSDQVIRRHLLSMKPNESDCKTEFSFSFQLANRYLQAQHIYQQTTKKTETYTKSDKTIFKKLLLANTWEQSNNLDVFLENLSKWLTNNSGVYGNDDLQGYQILLNYRHTSNSSIVKRFKLNSVLAGKFSSEDIKGKVIIIGNSPLNKTSQFLTPYSGSSYKSISPAELQAQMVSQIINAVLKEKRHLLSFMPKWIEVIWLWTFISIGISIAIIYFSQWNLLIFSDGITLIIIGILSWVGLQFFGYWILVVRTILLFIIANVGTFLLISKFN